MGDFILGVEIGGTKQQLALGNLRGEILAAHRGRVAVSTGGEGIRDWLAAQIPAFIASAEEKFGPVIAVGCGFGGPIDTRAGRVLNSIQVQGWRDFPIKDWFESQFGLPAVIANDSNAAAWGEYCRGFGRGCRHFFYTNMGSGVGGGLVLDGALFDGQGFGAGEFGQTYVPDWTGDRPGQPEKIENLCSGWSIESRLRRPGYIPESASLFRAFSDDLQAITARDLAEAAQAGDGFALHEVDRIAFSMGLGIANLLCLTNVERVAIGGGVARMGPILIDRIRHYAQQYEFISSHGRYQISQCQLGDAIVLVGAILLAAGALDGVQP